MVNTMNGRWAVGGALLCAGLLAAACSSEVTVLDGSSGSGIAVDVTGETEASASMTDESLD